MSPEPAKFPDTLRFGKSFELDLRAYELRSSGHAIRLEPIPLEVLILLADRRGELVTREQIAEKVWGKDVFLDTDNSINGAIRKIRQVLNDHPEEPRFIQTVTGRGYRFIAQISEGTSESQRNDKAPQVTAGLPCKSTISAESRRKGSESAGFAGHRGTLANRTMKRKWLAVAAASLVLTTLGAWRLLQKAPAKTEASGGRLMLAVLPFENLTGDPGQDYLSDGLTEEMITQLGSLEPRRMGVIARTSVMQYKKRLPKLTQIGRELGVEYVLEGSVRREAGRVRVSAQLIQTKDQTHLWARQYDRELSDLLLVQNEIAREVAYEIDLTLGNSNRRKSTPEALSSRNRYEAYDLYLKGQYAFNKRTGQSLQQAIEYFCRATQKDPHNARGFAGLAAAYALIGGFSMQRQTEFMAKARAAALRALEIDPNLPEAHTALALIVQNHDWDWLTAEREYRRAIELNPNYATAHHWYAEHLMWRGRLDEALTESERARQLDPFSVIIAADNAYLLYCARRDDEAIEKFRAAREMEPGFPRAQVIIAPYVEKRMYSEALAEMEDQRAKIDAHWYWAAKAYINGRAGRRAEAERALKQLLLLGGQDRLDAGLISWVYLGIGDKDQTFAWLEKSYEQHSNSLVGLKVDPAYDPLRGDPRFEDLLHRVGLAE